MPILTFFFLSSLLSKINKKIKLKHGLFFEIGSKRNFVQVLANGGVAVTLMILQIMYPTHSFFLPYVGSLSAAMADTWSTEIGIFSKKLPRTLSTFKQVPKGTSGGISPMGTFGGMIGAFILALSACPFLSRNLDSFPLKEITIITFTGLLGSLVDSLLGALFQSRYQCSSCSAITENKNHCTAGTTRLIKGFSWMTNDMVNFLNTLCGAVLILMLGRFL